MSGVSGSTRINQALGEVAAGGNRMLRTLLLGLQAEAQLRAGDELARRTVAEALAEQRATGERLYAKQLAELQRQTG